MKTPAKKENAQSKKTIKVDSFEINRAAVVGKSNSVVFDLTINGVTIYGCFVKTSKDGKDFISFPQRKGQDKEGNDKYYHIAYAPLSEEDQKAILEEVENIINAD